MEKHGEYICCICGKKKIGWGNNPWPVNNEPDARCCDNCNLYVVVPARIENAGKVEPEEPVQMAIDDIIPPVEKKNGKKSNYQRQTV